MYSNVDLLHTQSPRGATGSELQFLRMHPMMIASTGWATTKGQHTLNPEEHDEVDN